jgi:hypothetical protein
MQYWLNPLNTIQLLKGDGENLYYLYNFINTCKKKWKIFILPEISNLIELVRSENVYIYMIMIDKEIQAAYFFRKVCTSIMDKKEVISCFASIRNIIKEEIFIQGFKIALSQIIKKYKYFHYLCMEDISDNNILIKNLLIKSIPISIHPTAYFFYNFAYKTLPSNKILILN